MPLSSGRAIALYGVKLARVYLLRDPKMLNLMHAIRLDYLSCVLTIAATILIGRKLWQGWVIAAINSAVVCVIGVRTAQFGFVPANLLCIALYAGNLFQWRFKPQSSPVTLENDSHS